MYNLNDIENSDLFKKVSDKLKGYTPECYSLYYSDKDKEIEINGNDGIDWISLLKIINENNICLDINYHEMSPKWSGYIWLTNGDRIDIRQLYISKDNIYYLDVVHYVFPKKPKVSKSITYKIKGV